MAKRPKSKEITKRNKQVFSNVKPELMELYLLDVYHTPKNLLPNLEQMRVRLAKNANQRLRELEKADLKFYAYDVVANYLRTHRPESDAVRFSQSQNYLAYIHEKDPKIRKSNEAALKHEIQVLQNFLLSESSTIAGQREIENRRIQTFSNWVPKDEKGLKRKNFKGIDMSREAQTKVFYRFLNSETFKKLRQVFSSEQIFMAYKNGNIDGSKAQRKIQEKLEEYVNSKEEKSIKGLYESVGATPIPFSSN